MISPPGQLALAPTSAARLKPGDPATLTGPAGPKLAGRASPVPPAATGRELALPYAAQALARMAEMIGDPDPKAALPACREIIDRAWGKTEARGSGEEDLIVVVIQARETEDA